MRLLVHLLLVWAGLIHGPVPPAAKPDPRIAEFERVADCETGGWVNRGQSFVPHSAVWNQRASARDPFWGGLQFTRSTWRSFGGLRYGATAADASPSQQITVAERVLAVQGWSAWPVCSRLTHATS